MKDQDFEFDCRLTTQVFSRPGLSAESPVALLLHGYGQTGVDILKSVEPVLPKDWYLLAPNGPFPFYSGKQKKMVASWFFFDMQTRKYVIGRETAMAMLKSIIPQFIGPKQKLYIIGYSQGAYMVPFVGLLDHLPEKAVLLNGRLRHEELENVKSQFPLLAINGAKDEQVDPVNAEKSAQILRGSGWQVDFKLIPTAGHDLDSSILAALKDLSNG